ncbi:MAG TPA: segregation/condensation protein A [Chitinophagales bacterium]|jgi:segregation and condensation protein A|nr:segregation/condensation protein A [Chitinophagales bacterium]
MSTYQIKLPQFEGPFDLLLYFIQRDEINIYDIPIAKLADDFLDYLHQLEQMNIDIAGDFLVMAATLMQVKAKMLLPRKELNEQGEEIDPRAELAEKIIAYQSFKEIVHTMGDLETERQQKFERGNLVEELNQIAGKFETEAELESISLYKLMQVFGKVMAKYEKRQEKVTVKMVKIAFTIEDEKQWLGTIVADLKARGERMAFEDIFESCWESRLQCIVRFLAILEMSQAQLISIQVGVSMNNFWIGAMEEADSSGE